MSQQPDNKNAQDAKKPQSSKEGAADMIADGAGPAAQYTSPDARTEAAVTSTQGNMGDGHGIRGDYGNSDQTNGLEGDTADQNMPATKAEEDK